MLNDQLQCDFNAVCSLHLWIVCKAASAKYIKISSVWDDNDTKFLKQYLFINELYMILYLKS